MCPDSLQDAFLFGEVALFDQDGTDLICEIKYQLSIWGSVCLAQLLTKNLLKEQFCTGLLRVRQGKKHKPYVMSYHIDI